MASGDIATYRRVKLDGPLIDAIEGVLTSQLEHHLDRRLKSLQFLHQMRSISSPRSGEVAPQTIFHRGPRARGARASPEGTPTN
jgi:hypothetical protein